MSGREWLIAAIGCFGCLGAFGLGLWFGMAWGALVNGHALVAYPEEGGGL